MLDSKPYWYHR